MINGFNDDTLLRNRSRDEKWTQYKIMRNAFSQKGKPSQYRINLISLGRVGYSFAKQLLNYMGDDPSFIELNIWHPIKRMIQDNKVIDVSHAKREMYIKLLKIMTGQRKNIHLYDYRVLSDLEKIVKVNQENPSLGDITVVTARYDFSFKLKGQKERLNPENLLDISLIESICQTSVYDNSSGPIETMNNVIEERKIMEEVINRINKDIGLRRDRAENLIDSVIGIRELAKAFKGYKGNTIIVTNEVDTTSYVFAKQSGTHPYKTLGLSHNDQIRYEEFLRENIPKALRDLPLYVPLFGSHNEFITPVYDGILLNDEPIVDTIKDPFDFGKLKQQVADFGLDLFKAQGSSDEDAPKAIMHTIKSIMYEDFREDYVIRASTRFKDEEFFTGIQIHHDNEIAIPHNLEELLRKMSPNEKEIFEKGNQIQRSINEELIKNDIIQKEWSYEVPEIEAETVITKKPTIYISTGNQHEVLETKLGDFQGFKPILRSYIRDGEHFAGPIKIVNYKGNDYLLVGSSQGIISKELDGTERNEYLLDKNDVASSNVFRSIELAKDRLLGLYTCGSTSKGLYVWDFKRSQRPGQLELPGEILTLTKISDDEIVVSEGKSLSKLNVPKFKVIKSYKDHDEIITATDSIGDYIVIGDKKGWITRIDSQDDRSKSMIGNFAGFPILDLDCFTLNEKKYVISGDAFGFISCFDLDSLDQIVNVRIGELIENSDQNAPVRKVKYVSISQNAWVLMEINNKLIQYRFDHLQDVKNLDNLKQFDPYRCRYTPMKSALQGIEIRV